MLFSCVPETGGCEWENLKGFVGQLKSSLGTKYERTACLDIEDRNNKMPEILLEAQGAPPIVIESKIVVWPADYCRLHSNFHNFVNHFTKSLRSKNTGFDSAPYKLSIYEDSFDGMKLSQVRILANDLACQVHAREDEARSKNGARGGQPMAWHFGPHDPSEWGEPASSRGIMVETQGSRGPFLVSEDFKITDEESFSQFVEAGNRAFEEKRLKALTGYASRLDKEIEDAKEKFEKFGSHKKLLLLSFVGDSSNGVLDEDMSELVGAAKLPTEIDEVWVAYHDWVSAWDYGIRWKHLR